MEVEIVARASGPFGELNRRQRITSDNVPVEYLRHLVEIGVARVLIDHRVEQKIETKQKKTDLTSHSSASQPDPASPESKPKRRRGRPRKSSASTTPGD